MKLMKTFTSLSNEANSPPSFIHRRSVFISSLALAEGDFIFGAAKIMQNTSLSSRAENVR